MQIVLRRFPHTYAANNKSRQINNYIRWQCGREPIALYPQKRVAETARIAPNPHEQHLQQQITAVLRLAVVASAGWVRRVICELRAASCELRRNSNTRSEYAQKYSVRASKCSNFLFMKNIWIFRVLIA